MNMKARHHLTLLLTLLIPLMAAGQEVPDAGQQTPAARFEIGAPSTAEYKTFGGLSAVSYNTLNLPERYVFAAGDTTSCTYNAAGEKLRVSYSTQTLRPIDFALGSSVSTPKFTLSQQGGCSVLFS